MDTILLTLLCVCVLLVALQAVRIINLTARVRQQGSTLAELRQELTALLSCEQGMGRRIKQQQQQVQGIIERQDKLEISDISNTSYKQAMVLLQKGASTDELIGACDLSRGELELLSRLKLGSKSIPVSTAV